MNASADRSLGGFEQRLLVQLKAEVAARPTASPARSATSPRRRRIPALATAAIAGLAVALLSALPAAAPALAQAFPILTERGHVLPARLARALRAQWLTGAEPRFDLRHAYAFSTPAGTGYVVVDERTRWLCILVPGFTRGSGGGRCERVTLARIAEPALNLRITARTREEVVSLLPRGADVATVTAAGQARKLAIRHGVVAFVSRKPVTVMTTVDGRSSRTTYTP